MICSLITFQCKFILKRYLRFNLEPLLVWFYLNNFSNAKMSISAKTLILSSMEPYGLQFQNTVSLGGCISFCALSSNKLVFYKMNINKTATFSMAFKHLQVQWAIEKGCHVIGTCSSDKKVQFLKVWHISAIWNKDYYYCMWSTSLIYFKNVFVMFLSVIFWVVSKTTVLLHLRYTNIC